MQTDVSTNKCYSPNNDVFFPTPVALDLHDHGINNTNK